MKSFAVVLGATLVLAARPGAAQSPAPADPPASAGGQTMSLSDPYVPMTAGERVNWIVDGTIGPRSLATGVLASSWQTAWNTPEEWERTWSGFGKRYLAREADVAISNTLEAGVGAIWGEDPRYFRKGQGSFKSRTAYALKTVFLAPRRDGHLAPAWGRYVGNTVNNVIENSYLPSSVTTPGQTIYRSASGFISRAIFNVFEEFWPDVRRRMNRPHPAVTRPSR